MTALQRWLLTLSLVVGAVIVCYFWIDRPLALLAHAHGAYRSVFAALTYIPEPLEPLAAIGVVATGLWALTSRPLPRFAVALLLCSTSVLVSEAVKMQLKFVFGRLWPDTWRNNPSFIRDGAYGFNFFHGGQAYASFPSGHTTAICALVSVLWLLYPRFWPLYVLLALTVGIGLIGANYHFLGDVIAGGFLGMSIGWMTVRLWDKAPGRLPSSGQSHSAPQ